MILANRGAGACARLMAVAVAAAVSCAPTILASAQEGASTDVQKLIQAASWNQIQSLKNHERFYQCTHQEITPESSQTTVEMDTQAGTVERLIEVDGHPPSKRQCRRNLRHLNRIASSQRMQRSNLKEQQSETARRIQLFEAIPKAFLFEDEGVDKDTGLTKVRYRPNPDFQATSREGAVLGGLAGTMWVDAADKHIVRIDGHVINEVTFGWGFLAKLYPGGHYQLEQKQINGKDWKLSRLDVHLQGTMLLVKKLNVNMTEIYRDYKQMRPDLTVAGAVAYLKGIHVDCGQ